MTAAAVEKPAEAKQPIREPKFAQEHRLVAKSHENHTFRYNLQPDVTDEWRQAEFWFPISRLWRPADTVEVFPVDGRFFGKIFVWAAGPASPVPEIEVVEYRERKRRVNPVKNGGVPGCSVIHSAQDNKFYGQDDILGRIVTEGYVEEKDAWEDLAQRARSRARR